MGSGNGNEGVLQASQIFKPLDGLMSQRFVSESILQILVSHPSHCLNKKSDFKTPVIVPLKIPEVKPVSKQRKGSTDNDDVPGSKSATSVPVITPRNPSSSSSRGQKVGRSKAKTDLEKLSESSIEKPAHEKLELYKAIFDDSSDEEGADQYEVTVIKGSDNSADCNIKRDSILNSDHVNLLRNTSPPRGIFSALLSKQVVAQNSQPTTCKSKESLEGETSRRLRRLISERLQAGGSTDINSEVPSTSSGVKPDFYGPQLPQHIQTLSTSKAVDEMNKVIEEKMIRFLAQRAKNSRQVEDEGWVEKKFGEH
ncbi:unnamed protein product [Ceratitis capitata]|uniref:(Mediterranean fruit fly) hypothetical protein n=1 Tax=Ceratitis capitata TaxID=7213 RepID=A0A811V2R2_CERCA|nr:unnamed protein product [Ceratitis capitata]